MKYKVHTTHVVERDYVVDFDLPRGAPEGLADRMVAQMVRDGSLRSHLKEVSEEIVSGEVIRRVVRWPDDKQVHPRVRKGAAKVEERQAETLPLNTLEDE